MPRNRSLSITSVAACAAAAVAAPGSRSCATSLPSALSQLSTWSHSFKSALSAVSSASFFIIRPLTFCCESTLRATSRATSDIVDPSHSDCSAKTKQHLRRSYHHSTLC